MRSILMTLLVVGLVSNSWALTGLPEGGTGVTPEIELLLNKAKPGQETIRIDDMDFRVDVLEKSGYTGDHWPGGLVRYQFDSAVSSWRRGQFVAAAALWSQVADLVFIEDEGLPPLFPHIYVYNDDSNHATVGFQGVTQTLGLVDWGNLFVIAHEICHALGFVHEQSRSDRDTYVEIVTTNIIDDKEHNFEIRDTTNLTPYDFDSIMHYPPWAFLEPGLVCPPDCAILVRPPWNVVWQDLIGQNTHLSEYDIMGMGIIYGVSCHGPIYVNYWSVLPENGSASFPFRTLAGAMAFSCPGAEIRLYQGSQPFAPILLTDEVLLTSYGGSALIE